MTLREEHRQLTRSKLVQAARDVFAEKNYVLATVDDIAERARVGRATFYVHFESKEAVLMEILREDLQRQDALFRRLAASPELNEKVLSDWISRHVKGFANRRASVLLFNVTMGLNPDFIAIFDRKRDESCRILGETIPAFRFEEGDDSPETAERRVEAHLLLFELSQASFHLVFPSWRIDAAVAVRVLARNFLAFIRRCETAASGEAEPV
ncbi:MAG: TetR/AcrR family transcriptional regulator [Caulobacteraceae bacterium]|nr:TetR/AcrR family transcriptional regulator [Caulobacteraceae bacterium]